jgi:hypothetical protein
MVSITCYGGVNQVGGNKTIVQDGDTCFSSTSAPLLAGDMITLRDIRSHDREWGCWTFCTWGFSRLWSPSIARTWCPVPISGPNGVQHPTIIGRLWMAFSSPMPMWIIAVTYLS